MYFVYILYSSKLNNFYTGLTQNISKRVKQHNNKEVPFTSMGRPWQLVYYEVFINKSDAINEEKFLKTGKGRERRRFLLKNFIAKIKGS
jgi:putative endonuclease